MSPRGNNINDKLNMLKSYFHPGDHRYSLLSNNTTYNYSKIVICCVHSIAFFHRLTSDRRIASRTNKKPRTGLSEA